MFINLLIVAAAGVLAPLALGFFRRVRLPAIVLEIVLGIVIGHSGLGWVEPDAQSRSWPSWGWPSCSFSLAWRPTSTASVAGS